MVIEDPARKEPEAKAAVPAETPEADPPRRTATRRGTRGGRSRSRTTAAEAGETTAEAPAEESSEDKPAPRRRTPRTRARATEGEEDKTVADEDADEKPRRATARRRPTTEAEPATDGIASREIVRAIEDLGQQIKELTKLQKELLAGSGGAPGASTRQARVGVFVDVANVELGADRLRARIDWGKVLRMLTRDRQLIRAIAYSPVHDDPGVSRETQRFVEPFLDKGYKITTKPLKRFADGSVKANVDIELALDVVNMLDRLDVVCLVSGDGDFEPLVVAAQNRGVRVEVVSVGSSTAGSLRQAADRHIDLQAVLSEIRV